jgi:small conductance mechanosensitive channel
MKEIVHNIPEALLVILLFYGLSVFIDRLLLKYDAQFDTDTSEIFKLLSNSQRALLLIVASIMAVGKLGFDVSALVAGLGLSGFALGFALKDAISNLIAGIMIVVYKPCEIGDRIELSGTEGKIIDINLRYLTVTTAAGNCLIPNSLILNNKLTLCNG